MQVQLSPKVAATVSVSSKHIEGISSVVRNFVGTYHDSIRNIIRALDVTQLQKLNHLPRRRGGGGGGEEGYRYSVDQFRYIIIQLKIIGSSLLNLRERNAGLE